MRTRTDEQPELLRVLVADDNPVVRAGLTALLGGHPDIEVVAQVSNGTEAVSAAERVHPDVVLLDVHMPGTDGLTALPQLALLAPVMMLTYSSEPEVVRQALHRGASGYLVHGGFTTEELTEAVRAVGRGTEATDSLGVSYEPSKNSSHLQPFMALLSKPPRTPISTPHNRNRTRPHTYTRDRLDFGLSAREVEVMDLIATGMSNQQIAATCFISEKTVKNHINRIFAKLHSTTRSESIARWLGTAREGWE